MSNNTGVIHDIGFRHYDGPRLGRGYLVRSLYIESLRGCYGLGRSAKSKIMPFLLLVVMVAPAVIVAVVAGVTKLDKLPISYVQYMFALGAAIAIFVAAQAPATVSRDLRFRVMPLYLSRPLTRNDYVLAKYGAMSSALFILIAVPQTALFAGALLAKMSFWPNAKDWAAGLLGALFLSLVLGGIGLLIASVTPRRGFGVAAVITVQLLLGLVSGVLASLADVQGHRSLAGYVALINPVSLVQGVLHWMVDTPVSYPQPPPGTVGGLVFTAAMIAVIAGCYALLIARYRKVSAS
ncbi:ABC transporter permease [Kineosporia sp. J2-2]|uniref:ABC transporter permease n=1 Tax=Kineosporia corallincola TaxID=2835133 RepID=A0ABS5THY9_9ACTN|nr:ABC transporter permease [Kineosporia corallincola]MBT0769811.1 ABC transporter permease [Kineosporia corallincola]